MIKLKDGRIFLCDSDIEKNAEYHDLVGAAEKEDSLIKQKDEMYFVLKKKDNTKYNFDLVDRTSVNSYYKKPQMLNK